VVGKIESRADPLTLPDPFRRFASAMEPARELKAKRSLRTLKPSQSSEVLWASGHLTTLHTIRRLHEASGIPARSLAPRNNPKTKKKTKKKKMIVRNRSQTSRTVAWSGKRRFPIAEWCSLEWIRAHSRKVRTRAEEVCADFSQRRDVSALRFSTKRASIRSAREMDPYALEAWSGREHRRGSRAATVPYEGGVRNLEFMRESAPGQLSEQGRCWRVSFLVVLALQLSSSHTCRIASRAPPICSLFVLGFFFFFRPVNTV